MEKNKPYRHPKTEYDEEPVYYCKSCHSLHILRDETLANPFWDGSYCADCLSTDITSCYIDEWVAEEERREKLRREIEWNK